MTVEKIPTEKCRDEISGGPLSIRVEFEYFDEPQTNVKIKGNYESKLSKNKRVI